MPVFFVYEDLCKNVFYNHVVAQYINAGILKMWKTCVACVNISIWKVVWLNIGD